MRMAPYSASLPRDAPPPTAHRQRLPGPDSHLPRQALLRASFLPFFLVPDGTSFRPG
jgi:hypothetical protein